LKFCMVTTFFGPHSFGGDAAYVERLSSALLRRGHQVDVIYNVDAFEAVRGKHPLRSYTAPEGLRVHGLEDRLGRLGLLWIHQTGRMGGLRKKVEEILAREQFDVLHFHNISLMGGVDALGVASPEKTIRVMTAHEHWLVCPLTVLWKKNREVCERPACVSCTMAAGRPPQLWRYSGMRDRKLGQLDLLLAPSHHAREVHRARGVKREMLRLPYFLPDELARQAEAAEERENPGAAGRPYFAAAGRLVKEKGFSQAIAQMREFPEADLILAGTGPYEGVLRAEAAGLPNVHFTGLLAYADLLRLYKGARALLVPSEFYETFGYVVLEAFSAGTPAIVRDRGALPELIAQSGAGDTYRTGEELRVLMRRYVDDPQHARSLGDKASAECKTQWSEAGHIEAYLDLIERARRS
jgi:glycosyltransferase involved in cell wall biosynthesis